MRLSHAFVLGFMASALTPGGASELPTLPGQKSFCERHPVDCEPNGPAKTLSGDMVTMALVKMVNDAVNALPQVEDRDLHGVEEWWTYPTEKGGDCEDMVLEKRKRLAALGVPLSSMSLAAVLDETGQGHLVLVLKTTRGDLVLDNRRPEIVRPENTGYKWVMVTTPESVKVWVNP